MSEEIIPFRIEIDQDSVENLHLRLDAARWPTELAGQGWTRGIPLTEMKELAEYWREGYDWRAAEEHLNEYPQFTTEIDGQRIHFLHVRSDQPDAKPLLITHGYPSSVVEFQRLIDLLVNPDDGPAFHVVAPSLPGYAFSSPLSSAGWAMGRTAHAWVELMRRLGYERYGTHGGDVGAAISGMIAGFDEEHVIGVHVVTDPFTAANVASFMPGMSDRLDKDDPVDKVLLDRMNEFRSEGSGYLAIQNSRPQTIAYGLVDSPVMQLAWIAEKFEEWTDLPIDRDQLLTNVSLYWFTGSGAGAAHTLYEQAHASDWGAPTSVPRGFAIFGADATVRRVVPAPPDAHWTEFERGRHFPAMEAPTQLAADLKLFFGSLT
ncbi:MULTISPECIES: epoxide hydrolase family protein [unclassified Leifsonia]|uniref:epoxide hydrolase family protein n=1 Tax=unclassified Leifsonia TaxID=2663824 RepID=UPI0008A7FB6C|nr:MULTISPECIES: epoxide hydrolase family protein [unclassified Leifsonia]SEH56649.1 Pimeloyl-ACP methyl ester carboxylesterase [Leifsonia sp. CL154]SFL22253.1 Pimeloyl-ACP methyl ester carboxylesterase [Leifsonia sp. CL147]